jgi:hypothetical protein
MEDLDRIKRTRKFTLEQIVNTKFLIEQNKIQQGNKLSQNTYINTALFIMLN